MVDGNQTFEDFRAGSESAFGHVMKQHMHALTFHAYKICRSKEVSEEIVADTFAKLWRRREDFQTESSVKAFLYITTRNACLDYLRSVQRRVMEQAVELDENLEEQQADPLSQLIYADLIHSLVTEIARLPDRQGDVFRMTYFEHLTTEEICERLGITPNAVFVARKKATTRLRKIFDGKEFWILLFLGF